MSTHIFKGDFCYILNLFVYFLVFPVANYFRTDSKLFRNTLSEVVYSWYWIVKIFVYISGSCAGFFLLETWNRNFSWSLKTERKIENIVKVLQLFFSHTALYYDIVFMHNAQLLKNWCINIKHLTFDKIFKTFFSF